MNPASTTTFNENNDMELTSDEQILDEPTQRLVILIAKALNLYTQKQQVDLKPIEEAILDGADIHYEEAILDGTDINYNEINPFILIDHLLVETFKHYDNDPSRFELVKLLLKHHKMNLHHLAHCLIKTQPSPKLLQALLDNGLKVTAGYDLPLLHGLAWNIDHLEVMLNKYPKLLEYKNETTPTLVHYYGWPNVFGKTRTNYYFIYLLEYLLSRGSKVSVGMLSSKTSVKELEALPHEDHKLFFEFWISFFVNNGEQKALLKAIGKKEIKLHLDKIKANLSFTFIGLDAAEMAALQTALSPATITNVSLADLAQYCITEVNQTGVHFSKKAATSTNNLPESFSLSVLNFEQVLKKHQHLSFLQQMLLGDFIEVEDPTIQKLATYQKLTKANSQLMANWAFVQELNQVLENKKTFNLTLFEALLKGLKDINGKLGLSKGGISPLHYVAGLSTSFDVEDDTFLAIVSSLLKNGAHCPEELDTSLKTGTPNAPTILAGFLRGYIPKTTLALLKFVNPNSSITTSYGANMLSLVINTVGEISLKKGVTPAHYIQLVQHLLTLGFDSDSKIKALHTLNETSQHDMSLNILFLKQGVIPQASIIRVSKKFYLNAFTYWVKYFASSGSLEPILNELVPLKYNKLPPEEKNKLVFVNMSEQDLSRLYTTGLENTFDIRSINDKDLIHYQVSRVFSDRVIFKLATTTQGDLPQEFELYLDEFKLVLERLAKQQPELAIALIKAFSQQLKVEPYQDQLDLAREFEKEYQALKPQILFFWQQRPRPLKHHTDVVIVAQDDAPKSLPKPSL